VFSQPIDEVSCYHRLTLSSGGGQVPNTISEGKRLCFFAEGRVGDGVFFERRFGDSILIQQITEWILEMDGD
jgi:hypothetical protein